MPCGTSPKALRVGREGGGFRGAEQLRGVLTLFVFKTGRRRACRHCGEIFDVNRTWQLFCSDWCSGRHCNGDLGSVCFYCGAAANQKDHIIPIKEEYGEARHRKFRGEERVPCCGECNVSLSNKFFPTITHRVEFLIERYTNKYKLDKAEVEWDEDDIRELGRTLRQRVRRGIALRKRGFERVAYLKFMVDDLD